jgi:putative transposase
VTEKFEFIDAERAAAAQAVELPTVSRMCALLEVPKSGYYEWRHRPESVTQRRRELLADKIAALFQAFNATYGYRRIHAELLRAGERVGPELVRKLMREMGLITVQPRPFRTTTEPDPSAPDTVDLVKRDFTAQRPGTKVVGDITYIRTWQGWLYLAVLTDCATREVIGYAMAEHMRTELVCDAVAMAMRNGRLDADCIMHSDYAEVCVKARIYGDALRSWGVLVDFSA